MALLDGAVVDGVFRGLRPQGPAVLAEGGARYLVEYDGALTIAERPAPERKEVSHTPPRARSRG